MKTLLPKLLLTFLIFISAFNCIAQGGTLDSSFGVNGKVTSNFATVGYYNFNAEPVAIQADGRIVVVGSLPNAQYQSHFVVCRFNINGSIDSTFGQYGKVETYFDTATYYNEFVGAIATAVIIQPDGKIVVGGFVFHPIIGPDDYALARYLPDGSLDSTFGINGKSQNFIGPFPKENELVSLALQKDGKILASGYSDGFCLVRYKSNGFIDSAFGLNGTVRGNMMFTFGTVDILVQSNRRIVTASTSFGNYDDREQNFLINRFLPDGKVDSSFGINGAAIADFSYYDETTTIAALPDGAIIAGGHISQAFVPENDAAMVKFKSNGLIDSAFGINGKVVTKLGESTATINKIIVQDNGQLMVSVNGASGNYILARFNANGSLDSSYGINGKTVVNFGTGAVSFSAAQQTDGKVIVVGNPNINLARFKTDEPVIVNFIKNNTINEGNNGTTPVQFKVVLNKAANTDIKVGYTTVNGTATAGSDYIATAGNLTIKAGKTSKNIIVNIVGDNIRETNERFFVVLGNPVNAVLGEADTAICTIKNDDATLNAHGNVDAVQNSNAAVKVFPNPAHDFIMLKGMDSKMVNKISVSDVKGIMVRQINCNALSIKINISTLIPGIYVIKIQSNNAVIEQKFIKQ